MAYHIARWARLLIINCFGRCPLFEECSGTGHVFTLRCCTNVRYRIPVQITLYHLITWRPCANNWSPWAVNSNSVKKFPLRLGFLSGLFPRVFHNKNHVHISSVFHTCHGPRPFHSSWFDDPNNIWWEHFRHALSSLNLLHPPALVRILSSALHYPTDAQICTS